jgi:hypothetical protein
LGEERDRDKDEDKGKRNLEEDKRNKLKKLEFVTVACMKVTAL